MVRLRRRRCAGLATIIAVTLPAVAGCAPSGAVSSRSAAPAGEVVVLPSAPSEGAVLELLAAAQRSLWMEMYLLTSDAAIETLVSRRRAGCDVRVILEAHPYQADGANQVAHDRLATAGIDVRWASARFNYTHA